jgi:sec-independent protein translocase protein TatC
LWAYVVPALSNKERHYALPFLFSTIALLLVGAGFAYLTLPMGLSFLISIGGSDLVPLLAADTYLNFIGLLLIGFGVAFELPLLVFFLGLAGVIPVAQLRAKRRFAIVLVVGLAAVVTPSQDPYTMLALAVPLYLFYEGAIFALSVVDRRRAKAAEANAMKMSDDDEEVAQR